MEKHYVDFIKNLLKKTEYQCPVCGAERYVTDHGNHEVTIHCASSEARFWDFERGTVAQTAAKRHWDQSRLELFLTGFDYSTQNS